MSSFYSDCELKELGFESFGENIFISRKASIYGAEKIRLGSNVRVDDFCILSGKISIGNFVHVAAYTALYGGEKGIVVEDFANFSSRISVYAVSDDYSGESMLNPMIPDKFKNIQSEEVTIERHVIIGSACVELPAVILTEWSEFETTFLNNKSSEPWKINVKFLKNKRTNKKTVEVRGRI